MCAISSDLKLIRAARSTEIVAAVGVEAVQP